MMRKYIAILISAIFGTLVGCAHIGSQGISQEARKCEVTSLAAVFQSPRLYVGKRFCGSGTAYRRGRAIEIFPSGPPPIDRSEIAVLPDDRTYKAIFAQITPDQPRQMYLEGKIEAMEECFEARADDTCFPYTYPLDLKVSFYRFAEE